MLGLILLAGIIVGVTRYNNHVNRIQIQELRTYEREKRIREAEEMPLRKQRYAQDMWFETHTGEDSAFNAWMAYRNDPTLQRFTEIVFVHSKEEARGFDSDVLVAWPSAKTEYILEDFNQIIYRALKLDGEACGNFPEGFELTLPGSLVYPITTTDLVEKWEDMNNLFHLLPEEYQITIAQYRNRYRAEWWALTEVGQMMWTDLRERRERYLEWWEQERGELEPELVKLRFAHIMVFENQTGSDSPFQTWIAYREDPSAQRFTEIVFVHSEREAAYFDENILVAWPCWGTWAALWELNNMIFRATEAHHIPEHLMHISMPDSLTYPLTFKDLVDKWEDVNELLSSFPVGMQAWPVYFAWRISVLEEYKFCSEMVHVRHFRRGPPHLEERAAWEQNRLERRERYEEWWAQEQ